jgi:hypothetical protein
LSVPSPAQISWNWSVHIFASFPVSHFPVEAYMCGIFFEIDVYFDTVPLSFRYPVALLLYIS